MIAGIVIGLLVLLLILLIIGFLLYRRYQNNKPSHKLEAEIRMETSSKQHLTIDHKSEGGIRMETSLKKHLTTMAAADLTVMNTIHGFLFSPLFLSIN